MKAILTIICMILPVAGLAWDCTVTIPNATWNVDAMAKAYYVHETESGMRYTVKTAIVHVKSDTDALFEGGPVAMVWYVRPHGVAPGGWEIVRVCGDVPDPVYPEIFADGFDSGNTGAWSKVVAAKMTLPTHQSEIGAGDE